MSSYWHPQFKWQLVEWFHVNFPAVARWKWQKMTRKQLYGKYKEVRSGR